MDFEFVKSLDAPLTVIVLMWVLYNQEQKHKETREYVNEQYKILLQTLVDIINVLNKDEENPIKPRTLSQLNEVLLKRLES